MYTGASCSTTEPLNSMAYVLACRSLTFDDFSLETRELVRRQKSYCSDRETVRVEMSVLILDHGILEGCVVDRSPVSSTARQTEEITDSSKNRGPRIKAPLALLWFGIKYDWKLFRIKP